MRKHVFPQVAPFIVAQMIFFAPAAILAEASLSFLGLGDPSIPTWGQMLEAGFRTGALYVGYWWWVLPPGILIVITALASCSWRWLSNRSSIRACAAQGRTTPQVQELRSPPSRSSSPSRPGVASGVASGVGTGVERVPAVS